MEDGKVGSWEIEKLEVRKPKAQGLGINDSAADIYKRSRLKSQS